MKINTVLGKQGKITIPYSIRKNIGLEYNDVISFEQQDENTILLKKENEFCITCIKTKKIKKSLK